MYARERNSIPRGWLRNEIPVGHQEEFITGGENMKQVLVSAVVAAIVAALLLYFEDAVDRDNDATAPTVQTDAVSCNHLESFTV